MLRIFTGRYMLAPLATAVTIGVGLLASPGSPAVAAVGGGTSHAPTAKLVIIPAQIRNLSSENAAQGNVIKPSVTAAGIATYHVTSAGPLAGIHACRSLGSDSTNQGVECADLYAAPDGSGASWYSRRRRVSATMAVATLNAPTSTSFSTWIWETGQAARSMKAFAGTVTVTA